MTPKSNYRVDLDGLRGIALALVACFHIWVGKVSGGVDVFLTLSGYFFIGSLLKHAIASQSEKTSFWDAINPAPRIIRLFRRLLPALVTVLIATGIFTWLILPSTRWQNIGSELKASLFYWQNWYLANNSQDYTAANSSNSPMQHLWSMSVQGQFFVGAILTALAVTGIIKLFGSIFRWKVFSSAFTIKYLVALALLIIAGLSLYWANHYQFIRQGYNYYDTRARLWEILAGGLLAIWTPKIRVPNWVRNIIGFGALGLIISVGWWIDGVKEYPGPLALVPVVATLAIIWSGNSSIKSSRHSIDPGLITQPLFNQLLSTKPIVWLGGISYSLYLWHWPLLIFYLAFSEKRHTSFIEGSAIIALSVGLAWATKKFIEDPLREPPSKAVLAQRKIRFFSYASVLISAMLVLTAVTSVKIYQWDQRMKNVVIDTKNLDPKIYPGARAFLNDAPVPAVPVQPSILLAHKDLPASSYDGFILDFEHDDVVTGTYGDRTASRTLALAGGSHAEYWITALDLLGKKHGYKVKTYLKMGCPLDEDPAITKPSGEPYPGCAEWVREVMRRLTTTEKPDAVFTNTTRPAQGRAGDDTPEGYISVLDTFNRNKIPVFGIRDSPWPHNPELNYFTPVECLSSGKSPAFCSTPRKLAFAKVNPTLALTPRFPTVIPLDLTDGLCNSTICPAIIGNIMVYHDSHHLSATFVRSLTDELDRQMAAGAATSKYPVQWISATR